jgi:hypothetical protein
MRMRLTEGSQLRERIIVTDCVLILVHCSYHHGSVVIVTVIVMDQQHACTAHLPCMIISPPTMRLVGIPNWYGQQPDEIIEKG